MLQRESRLRARGGGGGVGPPRPLDPFGYSAFIVKVNV